MFYTSYTKDSGLNWERKPATTNLYLQGFYPLRPHCNFIKTDFFHFQSLIKILSELL